MAQRAVGLRRARVRDARPRAGDHRAARRAAAARRRRARGAARGVVRLRRGRRARARRTSTWTCRRGQDDRDRGRHRLGQDDAGVAPPAPVRRRRRAACRSTAWTCAAWTSGSLRREIALVSDDAFLFSASLRDNIAYARPGRAARTIADAARRAGLHELHRRPARRLRHDGGRARHDAVGRPAPAGGHRPRAAGDAAHPDPRRRHLQRGRHHRGRIKAPCAR